MEGKERMRNKPFQNLGGTCACVMRGLKDCEGIELLRLLDLDESESLLAEESRLYLGDSWFGSIKSVENIGISGNHAIMIIKTAFSMTPKKWLEATMKDFPGGTWITMEGESNNNGVKMVCIGYKYNKKKVLTFLLTKGAGSSEAGEPYSAKFPDKYGNVCVRHVARPQCITNFF